MEKPELGAGGGTKNTAGDGGTQRRYVGSALLVVAVGIDQRPPKAAQCAGMAPRRPQCAAQCRPRPPQTTDLRCKEGSNPQSRASTWHSPERRAQKLTLVARDSRAPMSIGASRQGWRPKMDEQRWPVVVVACWQE